MILRVTLIKSFLVYLSDIDFTKLRVHSRQPSGIDQPSKSRHSSGHSSGLPKSGDATDDDDDLILGVFTSAEEQEK